MAIVLAGCSLQPVLGQQCTKARITPDIVYGHKDGLAMTMDLFQPMDRAHGGAVLFLVSGGWVSHWAAPEIMQPMFEPFLQRGYAVFAVRHGSSPRYGIPEIVSDVRRAVRFVRSQAEQFQVNPDYMAAMGFSAGGHLALMLGTTGDEGRRGAEDSILRFSSRVAAVVALVPVTDLRVAVWEAPESLPEYRQFPALNLDLGRAAEYSPVVHASEGDAPALIIVGGQDKLVPPVHGEWISEALRKAGVEHRLVVLPKAGHNLAREEDQTRFIDEALDWLDRFTRPPKIE